MACLGTSSPAPSPTAVLQATPSMKCPSWHARLTGLHVTVPCSILTKNRSLVFDIVGEGNLPRVTVVRPVLYNQYGNPLLLFKRLLLGQSEKLPLILKNNGTIPAQVLLEVKYGMEREKNDSEARLLMLKSLPSLIYEDFFDVPHMLICIRHETCRAKPAWCLPSRSIGKQITRHTDSFCVKQCAMIYPNLSG